MITNFVGWALAHRDNMVGQSPTLQCCDGIDTPEQYAEFVKHYKKRAEP